MIIDQNVPDDFVAESMSLDGDAQVTLWSVSVMLSDPPHPYSSNPRLTIRAETTKEIYELVKEQYPSGVVMGIWPHKETP